MIALHTLASMFHLVAIALWLGGMVFFLVVLGPAVHELEPSLAVKTLNQSRIGLEITSWVAIGILFLSGMFNLLARSSAAATPMSESYVILLSVKLFFFGAMVVHHCLQVFKYAPKISSLTAQLPESLDSWPEPLLSHWRRWFFLLKINATLGPIVVLLGLNLSHS
jgi:uncharacterized membrane protein